MPPCRAVHEINRRLIELQILTLVWIYYRDHRFHKLSILFFRDTHLQKLHIQIVVVQDISVDWKNISLKKSRYILQSYSVLYEGCCRIAGFLGQSRTYSGYIDENFDARVICKMRDVRSTVCFHRVTTSLSAAYASNTSERVSIRSHTF